MSPDRRPRPPLLRVFSRDPDRHKLVDSEFVQDRWVRLNRPGPWRVALFLLLVAAFTWLMLAAAVFVTVPRTIPGRLVAAAICSIPVSLFGWLTLRATLVGTYVRDAGIRVLRVKSSDELSWTEVVDVRRVPSTTPVLGLPFTQKQGEKVLLVLTDGSEVETTIMTHNADFLARTEAYDQTALAAERWWQETRT